MIHRSLSIAFVVAALTAGCSGQISSDIAHQCSDTLATAEAELNKAKADGLGELVSITKAASLVTAAAFQKQFERYEGCVDKAQRARAYIADARRQ